jgi:hypothetical protein
MMLLVARLASGQLLLTGIHDLCPMRTTFARARVTREPRIATLSYEVQMGLS